MIKFSIFLTSVYLIILLLILVANSKNIINKIIISNASTTVVASIIVLIGTLYKNPDYIDIAIIYSLLSFAVSTVLLFFVSSKKSTKLA